MRLSAAALLLVLVGVGGLSAQIPEGHIVISNLTDLSNPAQNAPGSLHLMDPATGAFTTLNASLTTLGVNRYGPSWVEMDANNTDLLVSYKAVSPRNERLMHRIGPNGAILATLFHDIGQNGVIRNFDLDHDDTWILAGGRPLKCDIWSYNHVTRVFSTLCDVTNPAGLVNSMAIDRGPGAPIYVLGKQNSLGSVVLMGADRNGIVSTISFAPDQINSIDMDRSTGDYIVGSAGPGREYGRVNRLGAFSSLNTATSLYAVSATFVDQEHTCWLLAYDLQTQPVPPNPLDYVPAVYRFDLAGTLITFLPMTGQKNSTFTATGLTRYGSRRIVAGGSGRPGTTVTVHIRSRKPGDAGKPYQLACSFDTRGGLKMPNGEYLDLSVDGLFLITATNVLPTLFRNFAGFLDASGNAQASVWIPPTLPPALGLTVFVSGVVIDPRAPGGISTVGNTHWFVLS